MGRFRIRSAGEGLHPTESRGEKDTDAALILLINTEWLEAPVSVRFPKRKCQDSPGWSLERSVEDIASVCERSRTSNLYNFPTLRRLMLILPCTVCGLVSLVEKPGNLLVTICGKHMENELMSEMCWKKKLNYFSSLLLSLL